MSSAKQNNVLTPSELSNRKALSKRGSETPLTQMQPAQTALFGQLRLDSLNPAWTLHLTLLLKDKHRIIKPSRHHNLHA